MDPIKVRQNPERIIQNEIIEFLTARDWFVRETHGNMYSNGWPDLYAVHRKHGPRWIEVKNPQAYSFTPAQIKAFPEFTKAGAGIWIMTAASESEYAKLFKGYNWHYYLYQLNTRGCGDVPQNPKDWLKGMLK